MGPDTPLAAPVIERGWIASASGARLALYTWPAQGRPRAVVLGLHGFGDSGEFAFGPAAEAWQARGITVYAVDQRGFGANPTQRQWPGAPRLEADAITVAQMLRARHPDVPLVVVGHSMGGGVALAAAAQGMPADGLVLVGPAIVGGAALNPFLRAGGWTMATLAPERRWTGDGVVEIMPTDNIEALRRAVEDPRHFGTASSRELYGLVQVMDRATAAAPLVEIPTLTLMGVHDEVLAPPAVQRVHETIPGARDFILYPDGWHWLLVDQQAARVWRDVGDFVLSLPAPG
jgi:alpha-beta hydrolase superfamily lysophospholipase